MRIQSHASVFVRIVVVRSHKLNHDSYLRDLYLWNTRLHAFDPNKKPGQRMPVVFVISPEWTLRTMVRAELREAGIEALGMEGARDMVEAIYRGVAPSMIVIDGIELEKPVTRETLEDMSRNVPILVVESAITPAQVFPFAEVLRRPVRVQDIVSRVLLRLGHKTA
jgi:hypothetical protein